MEVSRRSLHFTLAYIAAALPTSFFAVEMLTASLGGSVALAPVGSGVYELLAVRAKLGAKLTWPAWAMCPAAVGMTIVGLRVARGRVVARMARRPNHEQTPRFFHKELVDAVMVTTTIPQIPGLFAALLHVLGAPRLPTGTAVLLSTLGVVVIGRAVLRPVSVHGCYPSPTGTP